MAEQIGQLLLEGIEHPALLDAEVLKEVLQQLTPTDPPDTLENRLLKAHQAIKDIHAFLILRDLWLNNNQVIPQAAKDLMQPKLLEALQALRDL